MSDFKGIVGGLAVCLLLLLPASPSALADGYALSAVLSPDNASVTAAVAAPSPCTVLVAWYDGAGRCLGYSSRTASGGTLLLSYPASGHAPADVSAKAFLLDEQTLVPLCPAVVAAAELQGIELARIPL